MNFVLSGCLEVKTFQARTGDAIAVKASYNRNSTHKTIDRER